nr:hypothetical protein [Candidatus Minimicrobia vallesae]
MVKKKLDAVDIAAQQRAREQAEVEQAFLTGVRTLRDFISGQVVLSFILTISDLAQNMAAQCMFMAFFVKSTPAGLAQSLISMKCWTLVCLFIQSIRKLS